MTGIPVKSCLCEYPPSLYSLLCVGPTPWRILLYKCLLLPPSCCSVVTSFTRSLPHSLSLCHAFKSECCWRLSLPGTVSAALSCYYYYSRSPALSALRSTFNDGLNRLKRHRSSCSSLPGRITHSIAACLSPFTLKSALKSSWTQGLIFIKSPPCCWISAVDLTNWQNRACAVNCLEVLLVLPM